ncbi:MAG: hypothetical protein GF349_03600 [Candidatus Magasanikbacteria bacterium]|nr:hypothetical protein [Candidatus Magasanikbacteria bacterium]
MKNKAKNKKMNFLDNKKSNKKRNESKFASLKEAEGKLKRGIFNSQPASQEFKNSLKRDIIEKRRKKNIIMKKPSLNIASLKTLFRPKRLVPAAIVGLVVLVTISSIYIWQPSQPGGLFDPFSKLLINPAYAQDNFTVEATESDSLGVDSSTAFVIKSKDEIEDSNLLKENIKLTPEVDFNFEVISNQEFKVTPKSPLQTRTVYNLKIDSAYVNSEGLTVERDYSWAFQVKDQFKIYGSLPRDKVDEVPLNTGIEIYFSHEDYYDYYKYVTIEPNISHRFEKHGRTLVLVPNETLQSGTIYTITVDKNLPLENSDESLEEDFQFQFETNAAGSASNYRKIYFRKELSEFSPDVTPFFPVYEHGTQAEYKVSVYNLGNLENYQRLVSQKSAIPSWASYQNRYTKIDLGNAVQVMDIDLKTTESRNRDYLVLPDSLDVGFYALELQTPDNRTLQTFFQVTNIAAYINILEDQSLVWLKNAQSDTSINAAKVRLVGSGDEYTSNSNGLVVFDTEKINADSDEIVIDDGSEKALFKLSKYDRNLGGDYWTILEKDRPVYKPDDKVHLWGFLQDRDGNDLKNKDIKLQLIKNDYFNYYHETAVLEEVSIELDPNGAFSAEFNLEDLKSGYYHVELFVDGEFVTRDFINVQDYIKPEYQIELTPEKYAVYAGEDINLDAETNFFEGTPVPYLDLSVDGQQVTTDSQGRVKTVINTSEHSCTHKWSCASVSYKSLEAHPADSELGEISGRTMVIVANFDTLGSVKANKVEDGKAEVTTKFNYFDFDKINSGDGNIYYDYRGPVRANVDFRAEIYEVGYKRQEIGTDYDFINKVTRKRYSYSYYENKVGEFSGNTGASGEHKYRFDVEKDKNYRVKVFAKDNHGRAFYQTAYFYNFQSRYDYDFYELEIKDKQETEDRDLNEYSIGETVKVEMKNNGKELSGSDKNDFLFLQMQRGLQDYQVSQNSEYGFKFTEEDIPNLRLKGVWYDGNTFHETYSNYWFGGGGNGSVIRVAKSDRELDIEVVSEKQTYQPGEDVNLYISVKDKFGRGVRSSFNINLVDEAVYKIREDYSNTLSELYAGVPSGELFSYSSHETPLFDQSGAEGGAGCFLSGTKITMADGSLKNIEDIVPGDEILTYDSPATRKLTKAKVVETFQHVVPGYIIINDSIEVTPEHRFYINDGWQMIGEAKVGDFMLDADGNYILIENIEKVKKTVEVFNFHVADYHTYIANGIYVHNEKGGARVDFKDTAMFFSGQTASNGKGEISFKLPDNITSWRVNAKAVTKSLLAGQSTGNINVSKPVFVLGTFADEYLASDKPIVKLRAYGSSLNRGDKVDFSMTIDDLGIDEERSSYAFVPEYFDLGNLKKGVYPLYHSVKTNGYSDAVIRPISVIDSRLKKEFTDFYELTQDIKLVQIPEDRFKMIFSDESQGKFYNRLTRLAWTWGDRIDQKLSRVLAGRFKQVYFDDEMTGNGEEIDKNLFQMSNGGIALLSYADSDFELSAKIAALAPQFFDRNALANYFYGFYNQTSLTEDEAALSLYGLAALDEPVLYPVQKMAQKEDLSVKNRLYIALAAEELGDTELARDMLDQLLSDYGEEFESMVRIKPSDNKDEILAATSLAANLAAGVDNDFHERLWNYVQKNYTREILVNLEELLYIKQRLTHLKPTPVSFVVTVDGKRIEKELEKGRTFTLSLTPEQYETFKVEEIDGDVGVTVSYFAAPNQYAEEPGRVTYVSVEKKYFVDGQETTTFKENDVVEVRLYPSINPNSVDGAYTVTDILPSGLSIIKRPYARGDIDYDSCIIYPYRSGYNIIKTNYYKGSKCGYRKYYARVNSLGEFTVEPAVIQSVNTEDIINYSEPGTIVIENVE